MKGMELARRYYETYGAPMIHEQFPEYEEIIAAALTGSGSECYGYDDDVSRDHDFEPGFCLFIPGEDIVDRRTAFLLERAYAKLPAEFEGYTRQRINPVGGARHGVLRLDDYFAEKTGTASENPSPEEWLMIPDHALAEAVNGEVFRDDAGLLTDRRNALLKMPEDVRRKKLAGHLLLMAQSGQYNYQRCLRHGETGAAQLAAAEFTDHAISAFFLLGRKYRPYYKWCFRALRELEGGEDLAVSAEWLLTTGNDETLAGDKYFCMEGIASDIIDRLMDQKLTEASCGDLEKHAYSVNDGIGAGGIRNMHILSAV